MVSGRSRFILPALAGLLSLALTSPALADAPAIPEEALFETVETASISAAPIAVTAPDPLAEDLEKALLARVNADRVALGLTPLAADQELLTLARTRAAAQIGLRTLSHYDSSGKYAFQGLLNGGGFGYSLAGENLARLRAEDSAAVAQATEEAEVALMNSPLHRKNILEPRFTKLAIGAVRAPDGKLIYAQIFRAA